METDLAAVASVTPECRGLQERADEWWLGMLAIPKSSRFATWSPRPPSYRRGWTFALDESTTFSVVPFQRADRARAVMVIVDEPSGRHPVGWFSAERAEEAQRAAEHLNAEVRRLWDHWRQVRPATPTAAPSKRELRFEEGHEYAPDARWGLQVLTLTDDGTYRYEQRRGGRVLRTGTGAVPAERARAVVADLERSTFPHVPARPFPPGASVLTIALDSEHIAIDRWHATELDGYREAVEALLSITTDARVAAEASSREPGAAP
jgi:hypothetical protein